MKSLRALPTVFYIDLECIPWELEIPGKFFPKNAIMETAD